MVYRALRMLAATPLARTTSTMTALLEVSDLSVEFRAGDRFLRAVHGVSYALEEGETLGVVGESGCGKTVTALSIMRLLPEPAGRISGGAVRFQGRDLLELPETQMQQVRGREISMIFQEPMASLNPVVTVGRQISEAFIRHEGLSRRDAWERTVDVLRLVRMPEPERRASEYPHQLSGGMNQRVTPRAQLQFSQHDDRPAQERRVYLALAPLWKPASTNMSLISYSGGTILPP